MSEDEAAVEKRRQEFNDWSQRNSLEDIKRHARIIAAVSGKPCAIVMVTTGNPHDSPESIYSDLEDGGLGSYDSELLNPSTKKE